MNRFVFLVLGVCLVFASSVGAQGMEGKGRGQAAGKKKVKRVERVVEIVYTAPSPGISGLIGGCLTVFGVEGTACADTPLGEGELFARVVVKDSTGRPTNFNLAQDTDAATGVEIFAVGCGQTDEPVAITPGIPLRVSVTAIGDTGCPGVATAGTVTLTLSNIP